MNTLSLKRPFQQLKPYLPVMGIAIFYFLAMNLFEAGQQLYYIKRFSLAQDPVTYFDLLRGHSIRWLIWLFFTLPFVRFVLKNRITDNTFTATFLAKYLLAIFAFLLLTIVSITVIQMVQDGAILKDFVEYFQFFVAQKFTLFFSGYIGTVILVHLYLKQAELDGKVYEFLALKEKYQSVTKTLNQPTKEVDNNLISIKIGDKVKLLPLAEIVWIQSADYCIQIHTEAGRTYFLRQTMKAMENRLKEKGFIRIHRSAIVNLSAIEIIQYNPTAEIKLNTGVKLPIANSRLTKVRELTKSVSG